MKKFNYLLLPTFLSFFFTMTSWGTAVEAWKQQCESQIGPSKNYCTCYAKNFINSGGDKFFKELILARNGIPSKAGSTVAQLENYLKIVSQNAGDICLPMLDKDLKNK